MKKRQWDIRFNRRNTVIYNFITGRKLRGGSSALVNETEFEEIRRNKWFTILSYPPIIPAEVETIDKVLKDVPSGEVKKSGKEKSKKKKSKK